MPFVCVFCVSFFEVICETPRNTHRAPKGVAKLVETLNNIITEFNLALQIAQPHAFTTMLSPLVLPILQHYVLPQDFSKLVPRRHESRPQFRESRLPPQTVGKKRIPHRLGFNGLRFQAGVLKAPDTRGMTKSWASSTASWIPWQLWKQNVVVGQNQTKTKKKSHFNMTKIV